MLLCNFCYGNVVFDAIQGNRQFAFDSVFLLDLKKLYKFRHRPIGESVNLVVVSGFLDANQFAEFRRL